MQCGPDLLEAWYGHLMVAGNAYLEAVAVEGQVRELHVLRPDRMKLVPGPDGWPEAYEYAVAGQTVRFDQDADGIRPILHMALFHPLNDHYGLSPLEPAAIERRSAQRIRRVEQGAARQLGVSVRRAGLYRQGRAAVARAI